MRWSLQLSFMEEVETGIVKARIAPPLPVYGSEGIEPSCCYAFCVRIGLGAWCSAGVARSSIHPQKFGGALFLATGIQAVTVVDRIAALVLANSRAVFVIVAVLVIGLVLAGTLPHKMRHAPRSFDSQGA